MHDLEDRPPLEITDMGEVYKYTEYSWTFEYPHMQKAPEWHEDEWLPGDVAVTVELEMCDRNEAPWVHAKTVDVAIPNIDIEGNVLSYTEFSGEPHHDATVFGDQVQYEIEVTGVIPEEV